ncbi:hypothetical protein [Pseudomonas aeruginosa]|uniref:hypothetical protein n=1 Tax=Pseudomonas aeruginosa TaxID=287 RepID=UPI0022CE1AEC|nr:hypothetical protein [Pseudomonas aeruginosa]MCZ9824873.1 hypothetical protein [Pseudomonas aeruginosa]WHV87089.1 hypothetical protein M2I98_32665 [Pseudomonas aeruginosa]
MKITNGPADSMAAPEIPPGMTADDWYDAGYHDNQKGLPYEAGPHDEGAEVVQHWDRGWYAAEADKLAEEGAAE